MRRFCGVAGVCAVFLMLVCIPASAGSHNNFSNESFANVALVGVSGTTVSGSFTFNSKTDKFSNCSISFSGNPIFDGIKADLKSIRGTFVQGQGWLFAWSTRVRGNVIWYSALFNPESGSFWVGGKISKGNQYGKFDYTEVPEGDATLAYLLLSGLAMFAGILLSGKQGRVTRVAPSLSSVPVSASR